MSSKNKKIKTQSNDTNNSVMFEDSSLLTGVEAQMKRVTIKDLCPEEKLKIGELLRKLAQEKETKEKLQRDMQDEKKKYETKIELMSKEK